jgi:hypothetical protein
VALAGRLSTHRTLLSLLAPFQGTSHAEATTRERRAGGHTSSRNLEAPHEWRGRRP